MCAKILNAELKPIFEIDAIPLPRLHFGFDIAASNDGGFAIAWNEKNLVKIRHYSLDGSCRKTTSVGNTAKPGSRLQLSTFPTGEIAIGCTDFLSIQTETGLLLCSVSPEAWHAALACQKNGNLVRVEMFDNQPSYPGPPIYELCGSIINQVGIVLDKFYIDAPTTIVGDTYSHPDHITISCLSDGRFVVIWTQLGHHLGNSIKAQIFDEEGAPIGKTFVVAAATSTSSVNEPSVVATNDGSFLVAWLMNEGQIRAHRCQSFGSDGSTRGCVTGLNDGTSESRSAINLHTLSSGKLVARWVENNQIQICDVKIEPI